MSTISKEITISKFCIGEKVAVCKITQDSNYIQLNVNDCYLLIQELTKFIKSESERKAKEIENRILKEKELQKTFLRDAVDCERFIRDLEIIAIPLALLDL